MLAVLLALLLVLASCGSDAADDADPADDGGPQPIVIDSDMSVEGSMSILYLLQHPDVRVEAIAVSGTGVVTCSRGVDQALGLIALAEAGEIPVSCGPTDPLTGNNAFPAAFRASADSLGGVSLPHDSEPSDLPAPELLAAVIEDSSEPVAVYADGPLTNIALLLADHADAADNISSITFMGGAVDVAGTTEANPDADWNIWIDPLAADQVLRSGIPVTMVPLDATNDVPLTTIHAAALEGHQSTEIAETVYQLVSGINGLGAGFVYLWDQLNAAALVGETVTTLEELPIAVMTEGGSSTVGTTVEDPGGVNVLVATAADREAFEAAFFSTLLGEPFTPVDLTVDISVSFDGENWTYDAPTQWPLGSIVLAVDNDSDLNATVALIWLLGDATLADLEAYESVEPPDWVEVAGVGWAVPRGSSLTAIELTQPGTNIIQALTIDPDSTQTLGTFEVG